MHWLCDWCTTCSPWKYGGGDMPQMPQTIAQPQHQPLLVAIVAATCMWKSTNKNDFSMIGTHAYKSKTHPPRRRLGYFFLLSAHPNSYYKVLHSPLKRSEKNSPLAKQRFSLQEWGTLMFFMNKEAMNGGGKASMCRWPCQVGNQTSPETNRSVPAF